MHRPLPRAAFAVFAAIVAASSLYTFSRPKVYEATAQLPKHRCFTTPFSKVYPLYVMKAEKKKRTQAEVDRVICWLTGYDEAGLRRQIAAEVDFETFFAQAPAKNPKRTLIKGVICGVRIEEIDDPLMKEIRYLDKLVDDLARGRPLEKILPT